MHDLAIITVSYNDARWLRPCLDTIAAHLGDLSADVVVVDNASTDGTTELVRSEYPWARVVASPNLGFAHGNNQGLRTCDARYVLFINPDTEILDGTFAQLVAELDARPRVGLIGCRQITGEGRLDTTIRYAPNALRLLGDGFGAERLPRRSRRLGERELDPAAYDRDTRCDWTSGSFMLARREALESAGWMDERFFMYSEEVDLCRRIAQAGWEVRHLPSMTILHQDGKAGIQPHIESLIAHNRMVYAGKHLSPAHRAAYRVVLLARLSARALAPGGGAHGTARRRAFRQAVKTLLGRAPVPYADRTSDRSVLPTADRPAQATARS